MFFDIVTKKAERFKRINQHVLINTILSRKEFKDFIIELNTKDQLFDKNIDSKGVSLSTIGGDYSPLTLQLSDKKSASSINLFDTGDYYKSHTVTVSSLKADFITIDSDPIKDEDNLFDRWGSDIVGLTEESLEKLSAKLLPELQILLLKEIL